jgi:MHS family proline/betaine transporter-like MFS transporter
MNQTHHTRPTSISTLLKVGLLANAFEWYEFSVFGYLSAVIGKLFFQSDQPITELLQVFTLFATSYFVRPIGSIFFGRLGDQRGRRYSLKLSLILMTVPTIFIGLLPTYNQTGLLATCLLVALRMIQGFAMGGELPTTACYVFESAPSRYKSVLCSTVGIAAKLGLLLGSFTTYLLMQSFDEATLLSWGWRIPFWLGMPLTLFIAYIRNGIEETPVFEKINPSTVQKHVAWPQLLPRLVQAISLCIFLNVGFPILTIWMPFYLNHFLNIPLNTATLINTLTLLVMIIACLGIGYISQYKGYKALFIIGLFLTFLLVTPIFKGFQLYPDFKTLLGLQCIFALLVSLSQGTFVGMINDLFKPEMRSLGVSLAFILPAAFIGGTVPLICSYVIHKTGWLLFPAIYIMLSSVIALPAALKLTDPQPIHPTR